MNYIPFPDISPVLFQIGSISVSWYGLMYSLSFILVYYLGLYWFSRSILVFYYPTKQEQKDFMSGLLTYGIFGVILGGRIGDVLIYNFDKFIERPLFLFEIWNGGMSFHGGLIGVAIAFWLFSRRQRIHFLTLTDFITPLAPIGLFFGRIGNFINGELYGRVTDVKWAVLFPLGGYLPRHPSQLYEAVLEGILLFIILNITASKPLKKGTLTALFLMGYGLFRFIIEYFREIDPNVNQAQDFFTMGQILCLIMMAVGVIILYCNRKHTNS